MVAEGAVGEAVIQTKRLPAGKAEKMYFASGRRCHFEKIAIEDFLFHKQGT